MQGAVPANEAGHGKPEALRTVLRAAVPRLRVDPLQLGDDECPVGVERGDMQPPAHQLAFGEAFADSVLRPMLVKDWAARCRQAVQRSLRSRRRSLQCRDVLWKRQWRRRRWAARRRGLWEAQQRRRRRHSGDRRARLRQCGNCAAGRARASENFGDDTPSAVQMRQSNCTKRGPRQRAMSSWPHPRSRWRRTGSRNGSHLREAMQSSSLSIAGARVGP
mmetsp:Transcript_4011/g.11190  ORF Transcript_4011/g.11190 Transcript_4011/m.11190 type:complete len:219 (+) Transcript_4011:852-1508(+)